MVLEVAEEAEEDRDLGGGVQQKEGGQEQFQAGLKLMLETG